MNGQQVEQGADHFARIKDVYKKMVEEIQDYAIILLDKNGIIRNWNKGAEKIKRYKDTEIIGKHFSIFYLPEDLAIQLPRQLLMQAEETGRATHEGWRKRSDGSRFWGSITITAVHDDDGAVIGFCKVTRDLTDKKMAEDQLRMSEERYHQMVAEVQDYAIILLNKQGFIENWNAGAEKIKGYHAEEIIGKHFEIFYPTADRESGLPMRLLQIARTSGRATHEGWRVRKDGSRFWGSITITALHGKGGTVIGFTKVTRDLTEKKLAEDKLAAYTSELEIQNRELEQFAFVASHDLQEPLRKIRTFAELIRENFNDEALAKNYFIRLETAARRMSELIRSLLNFSRLTKETTHFEEVDLNGILQEAKQDFELLIEERHAQIISDPLPTVSGNRLQLGQLFSNLMSNSIKFCQTDPVIRITSTIVNGSEIEDAAPGADDKQFFRLDFSDNGIGFDEQYKQLIFSLFQRLHGKHEYAGTGIGLALCRKIVENHNGYIGASSQPGEGAVFNIFLPIRQ